MRKFFAVACVVTGTLLQAGQEGKLPSSSLFSYAEWQEIFSKRRCSEDFIVLTDGSKLCGQLEKVPSLDYTFTTLELNLRDIAAISLSSEGAQYKLQYITRDGHNFIGSLGRGKFGFWVIEPTPKDPLNQVRKEIDPRKVSFILLKERDRVTSAANEKNVSSITLRNGDQLPAVLPAEPIAVTDGWSEEYLPTDRIVELYFEGGIYGKILDKGNPTDLHFLFVKDRYLTVYLAGQGQYIRIPWDQVEYIQAANGGFKNDFEGRVSGLHVPPDDLDEAVQSGLVSSEADAIGVTNGDLLSDATAAIAITAKSFEGLEMLGNVSLQADPLFSSSEEKSWVQDVDFIEIVDASPEVIISPEDVIALVTPEEMEEVSEAALFANLEPEKVDPPAFDVPLAEDPALPEESSSDSQTVLDSVGEVELTPEAIARIEDILADDDLDDFDASVDEEEDDEEEPLLTDEAMTIISDILADDELDDMDFPLVGSADENAPVSIDEAYDIIEDLLKQMPEVNSDYVQQSQIIDAPVAVVVHAREVLTPKPDAKPRDIFWDASSPNDELTEDELALLNELLEETTTPAEDQDMAFVAQEKVRKLPSMRDLGKYKTSLVPTVNSPTVVIHVPGFYIDRQPVTNAQYEKYVRSTGAHPPMHWVSGAIPAGQEQLPVVNVSYQDAKLYAAWAGKRLPTETDWLRAIRAGVINPWDIDHKEWTATTGKPHYKIVVLGDESQIMNENYVDHRLGFRTCMTQE